MTLAEEAQRRIVSRLSGLSDDERLVLSEFICDLVKASRAEGVRECGEMLIPYIPKELRTSAAWMVFRACVGIIGAVGGERAS